MLFRTPHHRIPNGLAQCGALSRYLALILPERGMKRIRVSALCLSMMLMATLAFTGVARGGIAVAAPLPEGQIEPSAGAWQTWLLKSGDQFRLPAPPTSDI